jgi:hypothetical protein
METRFGALGAEGERDASRSTRVVELGSPEIFEYPFSYVSEPGEMLLTDQEVANLREYTPYRTYIPEPERQYKCA